MKEQKYINRISLWLCVSVFESMSSQREQNLFSGGCRGRFPQYYCKQLPPILAITSLQTLSPWPWLQRAPAVTHYHTVFYFVIHHHTSTVLCSHRHEYCTKSKNRANEVCSWDKNAKNLWEYQLVSFNSSLWADFNCIICVDWPCLTSVIYDSFLR